MPAKRAAGPRKTRTLAERIAELQAKDNRQKKRAELKQAIQTARDQLKKLK